MLLVNALWWQRLGDPALDALVARALAGNLDIAAARARIAEAEARRRAVPGALALSGSAGVRAEGTLAGGDGGDSGPDRAGVAQIGLGWLLDPYGARRAELRAAGAEIEAADAELDAARLLVLYNLANAYLELRYRQRLAALAGAELRAQRGLLALTRSLAAAGAATEIDTTRAAARVAAVEAQLPGAEAAVAVALARIAALAGAAPGSPGLDPGPGGQPVSRLAPEVGIPADLLRNRPDIRIAERRYYAAVARIDRARAALYPSLSLAGAISLNALQGRAGVADYYLGPSLAFPDLPPGSARAGVAAAHAQARQAHLAWTSTVIGALLEVETALANYRAASRALEAAGRSARLHARARDLTRAVFDRGGATLDEMIDAELDRAAADRALAGALYAQGLAFVELNVRLGSGSAAGGG